MIHPYLYLCVRRKVNYKRYYWLFKYLDYIMSCYMISLFEHDQQIELMSRRHNQEIELMSRKHNQQLTTTVNQHQLEVNRYQLEILKIQDKIKDLNTKINDAREFNIQIAKTNDNLFDMNSYFRNTAIKLRNDNDNLLEDNIKLRNNNDDLFENNYKLTEINIQINVKLCNAYDKIQNIFSDNKARQASTSKRMRYLFNLLVDNNVPCSIESLIKQFQQIDSPVSHDIKDNEVSCDINNDNSKVSCDINN